MSTHSRVLIVSVIAIFLAASPVTALDVALPSDFFTFTVTVPGDAPGGYYYMNPYVENSSAGPRLGFGLVLDSRGNVVLFRNEGPITNIHAIEHSQQYTYGYPTSSHPVKLYVLDSGWEVVEEIDSQHPTDPDLTLDGHEFLFMEDGTTWSEWWDTRTVDMSQYINGGQTSVEVTGHAVQHWDADGEILFDWRSWDHLDDLPFTARPDCTKLYDSEFEHLHINSIEVEDDYIYLSARFTSVVYKVSRATGEVIWGCGYGPANDFTFTGPPVVPSDFNYQHDCRILDNGNLTVFDNGNAHDPPYAYAKEYTLDEDNMVADLVWWASNDPPSYAAITGSHQKLENGNHVIGWGNIDPQVAASELSSEGEVLWSLAFDRFQPYSRYPGTYRVNKSDQFTPSYRPYVSYSDLGDSFEIQCNWFGHEDEVAGYNVYGGFAEDDLEMWGITTSGYYFIDNPSPFNAYYVQIVALNRDGDEISDVSNLLKTSGYDPPVVMTPVGTTVFPAGGGTLTFDVTLSNPTPYSLVDVRFSTRVVLPNSMTLGPLMLTLIQLSPYEIQTYEQLQQDIPAFAPPGDYLFIASAEKGGLEFTDSFTFTKTGALSTSTNTGRMQLSDWTVGSNWPVPEVSAADPAEPDYSLSLAWPNPFNSTTTLSVTLSEAGNLTVVVYNVNGQRVATLSKRQVRAGTHNFVFDASNLASGLYFVRATVPGQLNALQKVMLVR